MQNEFSRGYDAAFDYATTTLAREFAKIYAAPTRTWQDLADTLDAENDRLNAENDELFDENAELSELKRWWKLLATLFAIAAIGFAISTLILATRL